MVRTSNAPDNASPGPAPSGVRNDASTTTNPASAPTDRKIDSADQDRCQLTDRDEGQNGEEGQHGLDIEGRKEEFVYRPGTEQDSARQDGEDHRREMISRHNAPPARYGILAGRVA